ncbi:MAG TPA: hypothetical protein VFB50_10015, partial [Chloroflexota bacterium]|nr:hypothetical protein [Chloroflexota bacterium]
MARRLPPTNELLALYASGLTLEEIGRKYSVTLQAVAWHLSGAGYSARATGANLQLPETIAKAKRNHTRGRAHHAYRGLDTGSVIAAYETGLSVHAVGLEFGVTGATIARLLQSAGHKRRRAGFSRAMA